MKYYLLCFTFFAVLTGCDRLQVDKTSQIQIKLPQSVHLQDYQSIKLQGVSTTSTIVPTGFDGTAPINCYVVGAAGPEDSLRQNTCGRMESGSEFTPFFIGTWVGGAIAGSTLSLDVPSGKDRVIFVVGFHATSATACRDFRTYGFPDKTEMSDPYLLGELGKLELIPGETKDLPIPITFSTSKRFDKCIGPDFPDNNSTPSNPSNPGNTTAPTTLTIARDRFPAETFVESACQDFDLRLSDTSGKWAVFNQDIQVIPDVKLGGTAQSFYKSYNDCVLNSPASFITIPAGSNYGHVVIKTPSAISYSMVELNISSTTAPSPLATQGAGLYSNVSNLKKSADLDGPDRIVPNQCYQYELNLKNITYGLDSTNPSLTVDLNNSSNISVYETMSACMSNTGALSSIAFFSYSPTKSVFLKKNDLDTLPANFNFTFPSSPLDYIPLSKKIGHGWGSSNVAGAVVWGDNTLGYSSCYMKPHVIYVVNENGTPIVPTSATMVNFTTTGTVAISTSPTCSTSQTSGSVSIPAGVSGLKVWLAISGYGTGSITVNTGTYTPRTLNLTVQ